MLDLAKLENVLEQKYNLSLKDFTNGHEDYFSIKIEELSIEVVKDGNTLMAGINLGAMDIATHDIPQLHVVIHNLNQSDPLQGSIIQLIDMDNYFYLKLLEPLLHNKSTEKEVFELIDYLIEIGQDPQISGGVADYLSYD